jgi:putative ABC transport system permease protein
MNIGEHFIESLSSLTSNKLRSGLTILGIVIGVASVISMLAIGNGAQASITGSINSIGANLIYVSSGNQAGKVTNPKPITTGDATTLSQLPDVAAVAAIVNANGDITYNGQDTRTQVQGVTTSFAGMRNMTTSQGDFFTDANVSEHSSVAVLGNQVAVTLFGDATNPAILGSTIRISGQPFRVVGVLTSKGGSGFGSQDNMVLVPISTAQSRLSLRRRQPDAVDQILVQATSSDTVNAAGDGITATLNTRHHINNGVSDFTLLKTADILSIASSITGVLTLVLGGIGGISLLVGGIGIMNIMLVSVTERTREIGLRKALGARKNDIRLQFLIESAVLSLLGGIIGVILAWGIATLIGRIAAANNTAITPLIDMNSILLATLFSAAVGLFFGFYPANRAANLEPVEALRSE